MNLLHLVYPPLCLHCKERVLKDRKILCNCCADLLALIDPERRCQKCCAESALKICKECQKTGASHSKLTYCFESLGPASSLLHAFKHRLYLSSHLAAWMVVQMEKMAFPLPDLILPFPQPFLEQLFFGYNRATLLADEIGRLYQVPVKKHLRLKGDSFFYWKRLEDISDKTLLLVVEKIPKVALLSKCVEQLQTGYPKSIFIIACV